jgi:hypothetical protein
MTGLEILVAVAGVLVMCLVVAGMILITPLGEEPVHTNAADANGSNLSPVDDRTARAAARAPSVPPR